MSEIMQESDEFDQAPPYSNRGVQDTSRSSLRACVDWLQATFTFFTDVQIIYDLLCVEKENFVPQDRGLYGYRTHYKFGHISVLADGAAGMGIHVQFTGQACREYEALQKKDWKVLLREIIELQGKFARLDVAIDDIAETGQKNYFTVDTLVRKVKAGCLKSYFKRAKNVESIRIDDGVVEGQTLYCGKETSDVQFRFYDKMQERIAAGKEIDENVVGWIRSEIQARRDRANALAIHIINEENLAFVVKGILSNYLSFLVKGEDSNKSRWEVCTWWTKFIDAAAELKLTMIAPDRTLDQTKTWITKQVAPSLGMLYMAYGDDKELATIIADGVTRMNENQMQMALEFRKQLEQNKEELDYIKKSKWQEYMFKTGAHRLGKEKDTASTVSDTNL